VRSISIVFLIVAHSTRHVSEEKDKQPEQPVTLTPETPQTNVIEEAEPEQKALPSPDNCERVRAYMLEYPNAKVREVAGTLSISISTANKWMRFVARESK
jgi:hypothetical protein